jgi:hypothetical protein
LQELDNRLGHREANGCGGAHLITPLLCAGLPLYAMLNSG